MEKHEAEIKDKAKKIIQRVNEGENVLMSTFHFSEIASILEDRMTLEDALQVEEAIVFKENIKIMEVAKNDYINSIEIAKESKLGLNDALAYTIMEKRR